LILAREQFIEVRKERTRESEGEGEEGEKKKKEKEKKSCATEIFSINAPRLAHHPRGLSSQNLQGLCLQHLFHLWEEKNSHFAPIRMT